MKPVPWKDIRLPIIHSVLDGWGLLIVAMSTCLYPSKLGITFLECMSYEGLIIHASKNADLMVQLGEREAGQR
jgi:hypothetical protein